MSAAHIINPDISADSANQYAPEFEMPVLKATDTEESIYAQDHIIENWEQFGRRGDILSIRNLRWEREFFIFTLVESL